MHIAVVLQRDFPTGGLQRDARALATTLAARGHQPVLVSRSAEGEPPEGVERRLVPVAGRQNHARDRAFARAYRSAVADCDLVIGFDKLPGLDLYLAADLCWRARAGLLQRLLPRGRTRLALERAVFAAEGGTRIAALTAAQQDSYAEAYGTPAGRFHLLPPLRDPAYRPVEDAPARRTAARAQLGIAAEETVLLFIGRDTRLKGLDRLLAALPPGLRLIVVGDAERFRRQAARRGVDGQVIWRQGGEDLLPLFLAADLLVHPSRRDAGGKVIAEALGLGLPVICSASCGYGWLVAETGAGALLPEPYRAGDLATLLLRAKGAQQRARWTARARTAAAKVLAEDGIAALADLVEAWPQRRPTLPLAVRGDSLIEPEAARLLPGPQDPFSQLSALGGEVRRSSRRHETLAVTLGGERLFLKRHGPTGWGEILKNWLTGKRPVTGADQEWHALGRLALLGIPAAERLAFGSRGRNPARRRSYLLMRSLPPAQSLEDLLRTPPTADRRERLRLAAALGGLVRRLHGAGLAHRDLYLCHLYRLADGRLALLDLHRAVQGRPLRRRWQVKDLAALLFSAAPFQPTAREQAVFLHAYHALPLAVARRRYGALWRNIRRRAAAFQAREARLER